ncbi:MAG: hypothetical protein Q9198_004931 [Flavoplaca austrocitrina]
MTVTSMDGHMDMGKHYRYGPDGSIRALNTSVPFFEDQDENKLRLCPTCRGSLRDTCRYGRIVRRTLLDESTKKFINWSNKELGALSIELNTLDRSLVASLNDLQLQQLAAPTDIRLTTASLGESLSRAARTLFLASRYKHIFALRSRIHAFVRQVSEEEQPFRRVWDFCQDARRRRQTNASSFELDDSVLQTKGRLAATSLGLRCDLAIVSDLVAIVKNKAPATMVRSLEIELADVRQRATGLLQDAENSRRYVYVAEGHLFLARCAAIERTTASDTASAGLRADVLLHVELVKNLCNEYPGSTRGLMGEAEEVLKLLKDPFYNVVTSEERLAVMQAMVREVGATGHWYYCVNGHPFTVGECGGPMQESKCPECDAPVGGQNHLAAEGVRHAGDLEAEFRELSVG